MYVIPDIQSHLHSIQVSKLSSKTPWRKLWILIGECPPPVNLEVWHFAQSFLNLYIYHSWHPKLARFYSGIKNVLQNSFVDAQETHRKSSYFSSPRSLKFCTKLPQGLYMSFFIHKVNCQLYSIQESKISSKTPWRTQRKVGVYLVSRFGLVTRYWYKWCPCRPIVALKLYPSNFKFL